MAKAKSAYSIPGKQGKLATHIIVVWVDNEAGVLARVAGLFSSRRRHTRCREVSWARRCV